MPDPSAGQRALLELEARVRRDIGDGFLVDVAALRADLDAESDTVREKVLALVIPSLETDAQKAVAEAFRVGQGDALRLLGDKGDPDAARTSAVKASALDRLAGYDARASDAFTTARRLVTAGADVELIVTPIFALANAFARDLTTSLNEAGNDGSRDVAETAGIELVWIAEPDACVDCLAYSGQTCGPGDQFPGGLTFADEARFDTSLDGPPLHPNCRCTVEPLGDQSFADALQREAERSVLRGFALDSESIRLEAAQNVLDSNPDLPKSVIAAGEKAVEDGSFPSKRP